MRPAATRAPLPISSTVRAVIHCVLTTIGLLLRQRIHLPTENRGLRLGFADGTTACVFRETVIDHVAAHDPCLLMVKFELRGVRGRGHALFRRESLLNTLLFAGFPGLISKLWLAHDQRGAYRGLYEWEGPAPAETYARALWRILALVSVPDSIDYRVLPGQCRNDLLESTHRHVPNSSGTDWWRVTDVAPAGQVLIRQDDGTADDR